MTLQPVKWTLVASFAANTAGRRQLMVRDEAGSLAPVEVSGVIVDFSPSNDMARLLTGSRLAGSGG